MKVLFISDAGDKRGAQKSLMELMITMKNEFGVEPVLLTKKSNNLNKECDRNGIENYSIWYRYAMASSPYNCIIINLFKHFLGYISFFCGEISKRLVDKVGIDFAKIDLIHTNTNRVDIGIYLSEKYNIPHVMHLREFGKEDFGSVIYGTSFYQKYNKNTNRFIAISNCVKEGWIKKGLDKDKVCVIYNGLDTSKYKEKENLKKEKVKIVLAGAINKYKGQMQLVEAINNLTVEIKNNIEVSLVGEGKVDYLEKIKSKIKEYGLENIIFLEGYCDNLPKKLQEYDIGIITSKAEAFGRVTVEYMLSGIGVIASNTGANIELVDDGINGLLYEYDNPESLSSKIEILYKNPQQMLLMGEEARKKAMNNYTTQKNARGIYDLYKSILNE